MPDSASPYPSLPLPELPFLPDIIALRRDLHAHPEIAYQEHRTADIVARELASCGLEVHRGLAGTGVVGLLRAGDSRRPGRMIGLRADMDALPLAEENSFAHRSRHEGKMHACGHDGHTAMLLGAARHLARTKNFDGTLAFIFQPAEESEGGARLMIEDGLFERFPVAAVYGLHNWPELPAGTLAAFPGPVMAGTCVFEIVFEGHGCHAAMPHQGKDCIVAGSALVQQLQTVVSRVLAPTDAAVVSVSQFHAGDTWNILPQRAILRGTLRSFSGAVQQRIENAVNAIVQGTACSFGIRTGITFERRYPPTVNHAAEAKLCQRVAAEVFGNAQVITEHPPSMGAEDFSFMLNEKPGCYVWLGSGKGGGNPSESPCRLHSPHYDFNDDVLSLGIAYWTRLAETALPRLSSHEAVPS
ncbi:MAG: M20 family metallopeptidase [Betaproteobacteria bacterium]|nr:M20 family metallopeptidase [Betaproteobacteria bacterium]